MAPTDASGSLQPLPGGCNLAPGQLQMLSGCLQGLPGGNKLAQAGCNPLPGGLHPLEVEVHPPQAANNAPQGLKPLLPALCNPSRGHTTLFLLETIRHIDWRHRKTKKEPVAKTGLLSSTAFKTKI
ncbi:hypothetical protein [Marinilabilia rubra]|nr:hypothetical protein [Marinilabilia rubra]